MIATGLHRRGAGGAWLTALIHKHTSNRWGALERFVGDRLQFEEVPLAVSTVGGNEHLRRGVVDAIGESVCWEAAKDHAMRSAQAGACEHGDRHFGDHRHVDGHAVALGDAERLQCIGGLLHLAQQVVVGDGAAVAWLADPVEGDLLATTSGDMAIDTVLRNVELAVVEPLRKGELPLQCFGEGLPPGQQFTCLVGPEGNGVGRSTLREVGPRVGCGGGCRIGWKGEALGLKGFNAVLLWHVAH